MGDTEQDTETQRTERDTHRITESRGRTHRERETQETQETKRQRDKRRPIDRRCDSARLSSVSPNKLNRETRRDETGERETHGMGLSLSLDLEREALD